MRRLVLTLAAISALAGCHKAADQPAARSSGQAAAPQVKPGLAIRDGRLSLPAVAGNPAAAYFTLTNDSRATTAVAAVTVAGARSAEIHQTMGGSMGKVDRLESDPGTRLEFIPGGRHVMVFGLNSALKPGDKVELTLSFADGDKLSAPLTVEPAGGGMGDMH
jgi:copper(I)-binding protein